MVPVVPVLVVRHLPSRYWCHWKQSNYSKYLSHWLHMKTKVDKSFDNKYRVPKFKRGSESKSHWWLNLLTFTCTQTVGNIFKQKVGTEIIFVCFFKSRIRILSKLRILGNSDPQYYYPVSYYLGNRTNKGGELLRLLTFVRWDNHSPGSEDRNTGNNRGKT